MKIANMRKKIIYLAVFFAALSVQIASADQYPDANQPTPNYGNSAPIDPRVPPAGAYTIKHSDGSYDQLYTTGQTQPYAIDNGGGNNNSTAAPVIQPYIFPQTNRR